MPTYFINVDADGDGTSGNDGLTSMVTKHIRSLDPAQLDYQYIRFDLSGIPAGETVTSIVLRTYQYIYSATRGVSKIYNMEHIDSPSGFNVTQFIANKAWVTGTQTDDLSAFIGTFTKDDNNLIRIYVPPPPVNKDRAMTARTSEFGNPGLEPLLTILTDAATQRKRGAQACTVG